MPLVCFNWNTSVLLLEAAGMQTVQVDPCNVSLSLLNAAINGFWTKYWHHAGSDHTGASMPEGKKVPSVTI